MCGIRLPADQMVADGGSACTDLRWYCLDTWGCTERWTSRSARLVAIRPGTAETPRLRAGQGAGDGAGDGAGEGEGPGAGEGATQQVPA